VLRICEYKKRLLRYEPFIWNLSGKSLLRPYSSAHRLSHLLTSSQDQYRGWSRSRAHCTGIWWYSIAMTLLSPG